MKTVVKHQIEDFNALSAFANSGATLSDIQTFRRDHPQFFPPDFYVRSEWHVKQGHDTPFAWFQRVLKVVWEGRDDGIGLSVLLGIREQAHINDRGGFERELDAWRDIISQEVTRFQGDLRRELQKELSPPFSGEFVPSWRDGRVTYKCHTPFHRALYSLMRESWRARTCPIDGRYLIAARPPNLYCSEECAAEAQRRRALTWWHDNQKGKAKSKGKR
jgi:hypothetical protein